MKLLEPLVRQRPTTSRFSLQDYFTTFGFNGGTYGVPLNTTMQGQKAESIATSFEGYVRGGLHNNGVVFGLESKRIEVFSQARFQFQQLRNGRPGDLFGSPSLSLLEQPWPGGTTGDLLALMLLFADFGGQAYVVRDGNQLVVLRPDWCDVVLGARASGVGMAKVGLRYWEGGKRGGTATPVTFLPDEFCHFAPKPDPLSHYLGMSWLTPVIREIQADGAATGHKLAFFENAATPNLAVSLKEITDPTQFGDFVDRMDAAHAGWQNAYKTLYLGAGADVTVIGADMKQLDFKATQGAGETRLAAAAGVPPTVASLSEGMQGSSLNAGNFGQARRQFVDTTISHLWQNVAGSLQTLVPAPAGSRLWVDSRDIPFLREDQKDAAEILKENFLALESGVRAGFKPDSVVAAVQTGDLTLLEHTGLYSVQLQPAGTEPSPAG